MTADVQPVIDRWIEAERANDLTSIAPLVDDDFAMVGPAGFILQREQWLHRFDDGTLHNDSFALTDFSFRMLDGLVVGIGVQRQETTYQGRPNNGNFRITTFFIPRDGTWKLFGYHLSPMMGPA